MKLGIFLLLVASSVLANEHGGEHHGGASTLIAPFVNVAILAGFLIYKLKTPLSNYFKTMSENISNTIERASIKSKEAQVMFDMQSKKLANLKTDLEDVKNHADKEIKTFEANYIKEIEEKVHKLKTDANMKIDAEKKLLLNELNNELVEMLVTETKSKIKSDNNLRNKASEKLLAGGLQ